MGMELIWYKLLTVNKCKKDKDEAEFPFKNKETGKRSTICKECQREYKLRYYYSNKQSHYERNKRTEAKIKEFYENYKATIRQHTLV